MTRKFLDKVYDKFSSDQPREAMQLLFRGLREMRLGSGDQEWHDFVEATALRRRLAQIVNEDPITRRSFSKPRGYAGDAVLLDMIYDHPSADYGRLTGVGKEVLRYNVNSPASKAVRNRRQYIAKLIDAVAESKKRPTILSVACGHLREAELSEALKRGAICEFLALDQDLKSLRIVKETYARLGVRTIRGSVTDIIRKQVACAQCDLIYSSGLFDYLNLKVARTLTRRLFDLLTDDGILLVTNFLPAISAVGYMESYMAWQLIYRDEVETLKLVHGIPRERIERIEVFVEKEENIVFLKVHKQHSALR